MTPQQQARLLDRYLRARDLPRFHANPKTITEEHHRADQLIKRITTTHHPNGNPQQITIELPEGRATYTYAYENELPAHITFTAPDEQPIHTTITWNDHEITEHTTDGQQDHLTYDPTTDTIRHLRTWPNAHSPKTYLEYHRIQPDNSRIHVITRLNGGPVNLHTHDPTNTRITEAYSHHTHILHIHERDQHHNPKAATHLALTNFQLTTTHITWTTQPHQPPGALEG